jgi:hypothetical protein
MSIDWLKDESDYFNKIKEDCDVIFDIGSSYSPYVDFEKEVHYFDPQPSVIELLKETPKINTKSVYNCFGFRDYSRIDDPRIITDFTDHWQLCNITCVNKKLLDEKH